MSAASACRPACRPRHRPRRPRACSAHSQAAGQTPGSSRARATTRHPVRCQHDADLPCLFGTDRLVRIRTRPLPAHDRDERCGADQAHAPFATRRWRSAARTKSHGTTRPSAARAVSVHRGDDGEPRCPQALVELVGPLGNSRCSASVSRGAPGGRRPPRTHDLHRGAAPHRHFVVRRRRRRGCWSRRPPGRRDRVELVGSVQHDSTTPSAWAGDLVELQLPSPSALGIPRREHVSIEVHTTDRHMLGVVDPPTVPPCALRPPGAPAHSGVGCGRRRQREAGMSNNAVLPMLTPGSTSRWSTQPRHRL